MRTTVKLDPKSVAKKPEPTATPSAAKPYRTKARPLGQRKGFRYDNVSELIAVAEGEDHP